MLSGYSDAVRKAIVRAEGVAGGLNHEYVGTEHLLLGLIESDSGRLKTSLRLLGADLNEIRPRVEQLVERGREPATRRKLPLTPRAKRALELAQQDADFLQQDRIEPEHLLVGLLRDPHGVGGQVLLGLGLQLEPATQCLYRHRLMQMRFVEGIVRPVRASTSRKRKMRDELLTHLSAIYDEELARLHDPEAAFQVAVERFGEPGELTREMERVLPASARLDYYRERWLAWRAPESVASYLRRVSIRVTAVFAAIVAILAGAAVWSNGWDRSDWVAIRPMIALLVLMPIDLFSIGSLQFKMRDTIFGVFGSHRSRWLEFQLGVLIAAIIAVSGATFAGIAEWNLDAAKQLLVPMFIAGMGGALAADISARLAGPTQIRDTLWACLDLSNNPYANNPPMEPSE